MEKKLRRSYTKMSAKGIKAPPKEKNLTIRILAGWFKDSLDVAAACGSESLGWFSVSMSEVCTGIGDTGKLSNFGNASGASVSKIILSKGI
jgi:hypothetical protein